MFGTVAGMYESKKHSSALEAAQFELEEEANLKTSRWIPLLDDSDITVPFDKYSDNRFFPYLALDCETVLNPKPQDEEEFIVVVKGVSYKKLMELISKGEINVLSSYTILMGLNKLREMNIDLE